MTMAAMKDRITNPSNRYIHERQGSPIFRVVSARDARASHQSSTDRKGYFVRSYKLRDKLDHQTLVEDALRII